MPGLAVIRIGRVIGSGRGSPPAKGVDRPVILPSVSSLSQRRCACYRRSGRSPDQVDRHQRWLDGNRGGTRDIGWHLEPECPGHLREGRWVTQREGLNVALSFIGCGVRKRGGLGRMASSRRPRDPWGANPAGGGPRRCSTPQARRTGADAPSPNDCSYFARTSHEPPSASPHRFGSEPEADADPNL